MNEAKINIDQQNIGRVPVQSNTYERGWSYQGENRKLTFDMQFELARRFYGLPETIGHSELCDVVFRWVDQDGQINSKKFRDFVEAHPEVVTLFKTDPEAALGQIEDNIYEKKLS